MDWRDAERVAETTRLDSLRQAEAKPTQDRAVGMADNGASRELTVAEVLERKIWEYESKAKGLRAIRDKMSIEFLGLGAGILDAFK